MVDYWLEVSLPDGLEEMLSTPKVMLRTSLMFKALSELMRTGPPSLLLPGEEPSRTMELTTKAVMSSMLSTRA